jgi:GNAT superfamily N-acetyltransferase
MTYRQSCVDTHFGEYILTANKKKLDLQYIYNLLCTPSQYSTGLPAERFPLIIKNSVCFGVIYEGKQVGFSRVITDYSEFASIWDVFIDDEHRGKGVGKAMMSYLLAHPYLQGIFRWFLMTENAHELYKKYGFKSEAYNPYVMMMISSTT